MEISRFMNLALIPRLHGGCVWIGIFLLWHTQLAAQQVRLRDTTVATLRDSPVADLPAFAVTRCEGFFNKLIRDTPETAFFYLFDNTAFNDKKEVIDNIVATSRGSVNEFGAYTSHEFIGVRHFGEKSFVLSYLTEMPKKLLRWRFYFFSIGGTDWQLGNLKVDDLRNHLPTNPNPQPPPPEVQVDIEKFFVGLISNNIEDAATEILASSAIPGREDSRSTFIRMIRTATEEYGPMQSYELLDRLQLGSRHVLLTYITYFPAEPLRWQFLYRLNAPGDWSLINLRFDDMFDEAVLID